MNNTEIAKRIREDAFFKKPEQIKGGYEFFKYIPTYASLNNIPLTLGITYGLPTEKIPLTPAYISGPDSGNFHIINYGGRNDLLTPEGIYNLFNDGSLEHLDRIWAKNLHKDEYIYIIKLIVIPEGITAEYQHPVRDKEVLNYLKQRYYGTKE